MKRYQLPENSYLLSLFNSCLKGPWVTSGMSVQWKLDENRVLYFQCTRSALDWQQNFNFLPTEETPPEKNTTNKNSLFVLPYPGCSWYAHRGYVQLWKSAKNDILAALNNVPPSLIVGNSLGGALATLAHEYFVFHGHSSPSVVFGSPKVIWNPLHLNRKIDRRLKALYNVMVKGDVVASLPPWFLGFVTSGKKIGLGDRNYPSIRKHEPSEYRKCLA